MQIDKNKLINIVESKRWRISEPQPEFMVELQMCKLLNKKVYIYGASMHAYSLIRYLKSEKIECRAVLDIDNAKCGNNIYGIPIIDAKCDRDISIEEDAFTFITTSFFNGNTMKDIVQLLIAKGLNSFYKLSDIDKQTLMSQYMQYWWIDELRDLYYKNNIPLIVEFAEMLEDEKSFSILCDYIESYCTNSVYKGYEIKTSYKYFFDDNGVNIYKFDNNEVWLNCGASVGDTIYCFICNNINYKKIIAFEGDKRAFNILSANINRLPEEYRNKIDVIEKYLDKNYCMEDICEKITLVNMDIEGQEIPVLKVLKNKILKDRPVLAISMYHKKDDIKEFVEYFKEFKDYVFYIRKYESWQDIHNHNHELIFYAVPNERKVIS